MERVPLELRSELGEFLPNSMLLKWVLVSKATNHICRSIIIQRKQLYERYEQLFNDTNNGLREYWYSGLPKITLSKSVCEANVLNPEHLHSWADMDRERYLPFWRELRGKKEVDTLPRITPPLTIHIAPADTDWYSTYWPEMAAQAPLVCNALSIEQPETTTPVAPLEDYPIHHTGINTRMFINIWTNHPTAHGLECKVTDERGAPGTWSTMCLVEIPTMKILKVVTPDKKKLVSVPNLPDYFKPPVTK